MSTTAEFTEVDRTEALAILDRFQQIVDNEALVRGAYVTEVVAPARVGQVCGGRNACAIGSLWLAAGVEPVRDEGPYGDLWCLPGTRTGRRSFLVDRPALRLAYAALNEAAELYAEWSDINVDLHLMYEGGLEMLFETGLRDKGNDEVLIDPSELTQVVTIARDRVTDMALAS